MPIKLRQSTPILPKCPEHTTKPCELHCERCDIPICVICITSKKHAAYDVVDILTFIEKKNKALLADLEELGKIINPKYQEITSSFSVQKDDLNRNSEKLISAINKRGEEWHKEIDNIVRKMLSDIENTVSKKLVVLKEQEVEIKYSHSEITLNINELKKLLESNDSKLLISTNPEMQNSEGCLPNSSFLYQIFILQELTHINYFNSSLLCKLFQ